MEKFLVNSAILPAGMDPMACAVGIPEMLKQQGIKDIKVKSCYCCEEDGKVVFVAEAPNKDSLFQALGKINLPVASIMTAEEVKVKKEYKCPVCGMSFETEEKLMGHKKKQHISQTMR